MTEPEPKTVVKRIQHDPRCEATTTQQPVTLSCQRMALHTGKHQRLVEWE